MDLTTDLGRERLWTHSRLLMLTAKFDGAIIDQSRMDADARLVSG
jgi:hypothetical protein